MTDGFFQFACRAVHTTANLLFGQGGEPTLYQIQPGGAGRREVHVKPRMPGQPAMDQRCFVRAVIVQDQRHVQNRTENQNLLNVCLTQDTRSGTEYRLDIGNCSGCCCRP